MKIAIYIAIMALVTYLIRAIPFVMFRKRVKSEFIQKFLDFMPYAVLSSMTIPWIFFEGKNPMSAGIGFITAVVLAFFERSLITVAMAACIGAYIAGFIFL